MLTFLRSSSPVLVMISSMSVLICNRFHSRRVNSGKMTSFEGGGVLLFYALVQGKPLHSGAENFCHKKLESLGQPTVKISWS